MLYLLFLFTDFIQCINEFIAIIASTFLRSYSEGRAVYNERSIDKFENLKDIPCTFSSKRTKVKVVGKP